MKTLFLYLVTGTALLAQSAASSNAPSFAMPNGPIAPAAATPAPADAAAPATPDTAAPATENATIPSASFAPSRYETLWKKSPFAVETQEVSVDTSPDYQLVGIANIDGVSYASITEAKPPQEHFLISNAEPTRGMTLGKISHSADGNDTFATVTKDGQTITLKLMQPAAGPAIPGTEGMNAPDAMGNSPMMPGHGLVPAGQNGIIPNIPIPGSQNNFPPGSRRPFPRNHRPTIHLPTPPPSDPQPPPVVQPAPPPPPN